MTEPAPPKFSVAWSDRARAQLRAIDRVTALNILHCIGRYLLEQSGDLKELRPPKTGFRLRCGDYRVLFEFRGMEGIFINAVGHRREIYR